MLIRLTLLLLTQQVMCRPAGDDTQVEGTTGDATGGLDKEGAVDENATIISASTVEVGSKPPTEAESVVVGNSAAQGKPTGTLSASATGSFQSKPPGLSQNGGFSSSFLGTSGSAGDQKPSRPPFSGSGGTQFGSSFNSPEMFYHFMAALMQASQSGLLPQSPFSQPSMMFGSGLGAGHTFGGSGSTLGGTGSSFGGFGSPYVGSGGHFGGSGGPFGVTVNPFGTAGSSLGRSESSFGEVDRSFGGVGTSFDGVSTPLGGLGSSYGSEAGHMRQSVPPFVLQQGSIGSSNTLPSWLHEVY